MAPWDLSRVVTVALQARLRDFNGPKEPKELQEKSSNRWFPQCSGDCREMCTDVSVGSLQPLFSNSGDSSLVLGTQIRWLHCSFVQIRRDRYFYRLLSGENHSAQLLESSESTPKSALPAHTCSGTNQQRSAACPSPQANRAPSSYPAASKAPERRNWSCLTSHLY